MAKRAAKRTARTATKRCSAGHRRLNPKSIAPGASTASLITASIPFATILGLCVVLLLFIENPPANTISLRDAMMLATAGAMTAYGAPEILEARGAANWHAIC